MSSSVYFFSAGNDMLPFQDFSASIGLKLIGATLDADVAENVSESPLCFLSTVEREELHPYGSPPVRLAEVRDPIIPLTRGHYAAPYLVAGNMFWNTDVPSIAQVTKPFYRELSRWIRKHWRKLPESGFYIGPEAELLLSTGAKLVSILPGVGETRVVEID